MKICVLVLMALIIVMSAGRVVLASDYPGDEKQDSVFQKLGDLITGKYEIEGEPLKKIGIFQCSADQFKKMKTGPVK